MNTKYHNIKNTKKHTINSISKFIAIFLLLIVIINILSACSQNKQMNNEPIREMTFALGTIIDIAVFNKKDEKALKTAIDKINNYNQIFNSHISDSEVSTFNQLSANTPYPLSDDLNTVIDTAINFSKLSDGLFDITIYPVSHLWQFSTESPHVPTDTELANYLPLVGYKHLIYDKSNQTLLKTKEQVGIDLGSIAKGYIADELATYFKKQKIQNALINLGGNVLAIGTKPNGKPWTVGIQKPFDALGTPLASIKITDKAVVTSGIYERQFEENGILYHHIIDPKTGYPMNNELLSVSIISSSATNADALSTTTYMLGAKKGLELIENTVDTEAIFILRDKNIILSSGITDNFKCLDDQYTVLP